MAQVRPWDEVVTALQQEFMETVGASDWDAYQRSQRNLLERKVGFALYGPPPNLPADHGENRTGYPQKQWEHIKQICKLIIEEDVHERENECETWMAIIFVCIPRPGPEDDRPNVETLPVFKVPKYTKEDTESVCYIDSDARVYKSWWFYLHHNRLPACRYCYPQGGIYQSDSRGRVKVGFGETPALSPAQQITDDKDSTYYWLGLASSAISLASLAIPIAGPVVAGAFAASGMAGTYGVLRACQGLVDRYEYGQSIAVTDPEARSYWLSIGGTLVGAASFVASTTVQVKAYDGEVVSRPLERFTDALNVGSLVISGAEIANNGIMLMQEGKDLLECYQLKISVLLFTHSVCSFQSARTMISETQAEVLQAYKESLRSNGHRRAFDSVAEHTVRGVEGGKVVRQAKIIRAIRNIQSKDDFFAGG